LLRRLSSLCYFHCGFELALDYHELIRQAGEIQTIASELTWQEQSRFSTRQRTKILMGGLVGHVTYEAPCVQAMLPFLPVLLLGQYVHVGKGTVMGMGKYTVRNADWYKLPANK
jgi:CRISPR/Cas system endoribonuclease Cas6 (RAMP superfamily)